jgi:hypothetical protein
MTLLDTRKIEKVGVAPFGTERATVGEGSAMHAPPLVV